MVHPWVKHYSKSQHRLKGNTEPTGAAVLFRAEENSFCKERNQIINYRIMEFAILLYNADLNQYAPSCGTSVC